MAPRQSSPAHDAGVGKSHETREGIARFLQLDAVGSSQDDRWDRPSTVRVPTARFFAAQTLPLLSAQRVLAESVDNSLMDVPEDAF